MSLQETIDENARLVDEVQRLRAALALVTIRRDFLAKLVQHAEHDHCIGYLEHGGLTAYNEMDRLCRRISEFLEK